MIRHTAIYLDGGDPEETQHVHELLKSKNFGGLDGQTTNPTLIAKNLAKSGNRPTHDEAIQEYKRIVQAMRQV
ncbi:MAG: transaldolase family protein, partial [Patescibacteria group bacterium]|nr:transaldolase family protein [Patescibacteria group bacterium]